MCYVAIIGVEKVVSSLFCNNRMGHYMLRDKKTSRIIECNFKRKRKRRLSHECAIYAFNG